MNNQRRKAIDVLVAKVDAIKTQLELAREDANNVWDEEQEALDCIPENLQGSERYEKIEEAISNLGDAVDVMDDVIGSLEDILDSLDAARE